MTQVYTDGSTRPGPTLRETLAVRAVDGSDSSPRGRAQWLLWVGCSCQCPPFVADLIWIYWPTGAFGQVSGRSLPCTTLMDRQPPVHLPCRQ